MKLSSLVWAVTIVTVNKYLSNNTPMGLYTEGLIVFGRGVNIRNGISVSWYGGLIVQPDNFIFVEEAIDFYIVMLDQQGMADLLI
jgi:hypothetical protein